VTEEYNGWTNRETWATKLHLDNNPTLNEIAWEYARAYDQAYELGQVLKNWVEEDLLTFESVTGGQWLWTMLTDIGSLYRVNWREIGQSYLDEIAIELANAL